MEPQQRVQWPESFAPRDDYLAPDLKVVEPAKVRVRRQLAAVAANLLDAAHWYGARLCDSTAWRAITLAVLLLPGALAVRSHLQHRPATLQIICYHQFRAAEMTVWADDQPVIDDVLTASGDTRDQRPYWQREASTYYAQPITLDRRPHTVRVRVASTEDPFDHAEFTTVDLRPASSNVLQVSIGKGRMAFAVYPLK